MVLNLRHLESFPASVSLSAAAGEIEADYDSLRSIDDVAVNLTVNNSAEEFFINGTIKAAVTVECSRCLVGYGTQVQSKIDFIVCASGLHEESDGIGDDEDYAYLSGDGFEADITALVRQAIILALPMKPLCSGECRGLCSNCGSNLNRAECECVQDKIDSRWADLQKISDQMNNEAKG